MYTPGEEAPSSYGMVNDDDKGNAVFCFTCDVDPPDRTEVLRQHCEPYTAQAAAHAFESYGIKETDKTPANLMQYGPRYENWPEHLRKEALSVIIESRDGEAEFWQAFIEDTELGEFENRGGMTKGRMVGFFPKSLDPAELN